MQINCYCYCYYFLLELRLPSQLQSIASIGHCQIIQRHMYVNNFPRVVT